MGRFWHSFIPVFILFVSNVVNAQQIHFSKKENGDSYEFNYQWLDHKKHSQSLVFSLSKTTLFNSFRNFKVYKPELAARFIARSVVKDFNKITMGDVQALHDTRTGDITLKGSDINFIKKAEDKIVELNEKYTDKYLKKHWYQRFTTHDQVQAIKPDHITFASLSSEHMKPLKPLILEKVSIKNIRLATNYVLAFVQSIPYSTLESRVSSSGVGFNPPLKLLWENQGDCDSKVTLTAAILRSLMPRIKMVLVFIDNHAVIGIDVEAQNGENTINVDGTTYLLGEPTGPASLALGKLDPVSELAIDQGRYTAEIFH